MLKELDLQQYIQQSFDRRAFSQNDTARSVSPKFLSEVAQGGLIPALKKEAGTIEGRPDLTAFSDVATVQTIVGGSEPCSIRSSALHDSLRCHAWRHCVCPRGVWVPQSGRNAEEELC